MHPTTNPPTPPSDSGKPEGFAASAGSKTILALPPSSPSSAFLSESDACEERRLQALERYGLLETPAVTAFDRITKLAARCLVAPVAFVAWVDRDGIRLGSRQGIDLETLPRAKGDSIPLLSEDVRWYQDLATEADTPDADPTLVELAREVGVRHLATAPLTTYDGQLLGALCVGDVEPRPDDRRRRRELEELAGSLCKQIEARRLYHRLGRRAALREARHGQHSRCATPARKPVAETPRPSSDRNALLRRIGRRLEATRHRPRRLEHPAALLVFDLRGFRDLNARLGYAAGDRVLTEIGRRLLAIKERRDTAIHLGSDTFGLLMVDLDTPDAASRRQADLENLLTSPLQLGETVWEPAVDTALVLLDPHRHRFADDVLAEAEARLRSPSPPTSRAEAPASLRESHKAQGVDRDPHPEETRSEEDSVATTQDGPSLASEGPLRTLANEELQLRYRPLLDRSGGRVRGFEAQVRWQPSAASSSGAWHPPSSQGSSSLLDPSSQAF